MSSSGGGFGGSWHVCEVPGCSDDVCQPEHRQHGLDALRASLTARGCSADAVEILVARAAAGPIRRPTEGGSCSR